MNGKTVLITGANRGLGKETARKLAKEGAKVILACRNLEEALLAKIEIVEETKNENIVIKKLNLSSQESIRKIADDLNRTEERLDVLLHNAAIIPTKFQLTEDGLESTMATNHFGPFLLTHLLIDLLKKSAPSRIIVTSSVSYQFSLLDIDKFNPREKPSMVKNISTFYFDSKFANICFTKELARRLTGTGVTVNCFHPGLVKTEIWNDFPSFVQFPIKLINKLCFLTTEEGSRTGFYLATSSDIEGVSGEYFVDCKKAKLWGRVNDETEWKKMWELSEKLILTSKDPKI